MSAVVKMLNGNTDEECLNMEVPPHFVLEPSYEDLLKEAQQWEQDHS
jgi:hypothetical protein